MKFLDLSVMGSKSMPDIATATQPKAPGLLDWVGMSEIDVPLSIPTRNGGVAHAVAKAQAYVNLINPEAKGIHMSRLYLMLEETFGDHSVSAYSIRKLLQNFLDF